jgi:hypothetical protein
MPNKNKRNRKNGDRTNVSSAVQIYRGPSRKPLSSLQEQTSTIELVSVNGITSTGGGVINNVIGLALNTFQEYTNFTALYDEARLLACNIKWVPQYENTSGTGYVPAVLAMAIDRDTTTAFSTLTSALQFESVVFKSTTRPMHLTYKMSGSEDAQFAGSTVVPANVKLYAGNLTASTLYGYIVIRGLWQFRGRL